MFRVMGVRGGSQRVAKGVDWPARFRRAGYAEGAGRNPHALQRGPGALHHHAELTGHGKSGAIHMGGNDDAAVLRRPGAYAVNAEIYGVGEKILHLPLDVVLLVHIDLIPGFFRVVGEGNQNRIDIFAPRQAGLKAGKETEDVNFFRGGGLQAVDGNDSIAGTDFGVERICLFD